MVAIGLDIGTTSICGVVLDLQTGKTEKTVLLENDTFLPAKHSYERRQDPDAILKKALSLAEQFRKEYPYAVSVGITGQMHGILYLDREGRAVSPLYTWQDAQSEELSSEGISYLEELREKTGCSVSSGYGMATHYTLMRRKQIPTQAAAFCTIGDYLAMRLAGRRTPLLHPSNLASLGCFDLAKNCLDLSALSRAGISTGMLPDQYAAGTLGDWKGLSVAPALGDNQASFFGSVSHPEGSALINMGTGGQISVYCPHLTESGEMEIRPAAAGGYLLVGASLCGGRAYAVLEQFFRQVLEMAGAPASGKLYDKMAQALEARSGEPLWVSTCFAGTRREPSRRGSISGIGEDNFTPVNLIAGVLEGMSRELFDLYASQSQGGKPARLIGSGNGIRKNLALQKVLQEQFGCSLQIPACSEEAAVGAALYSCVTSGTLTELQARERIQYQPVLYRKAGRESSRNFPG